MLRTAYDAFLNLYVQIRGVNHCTEVVLRRGRTVAYSCNQTLDVGDVKVAFALYVERVEQHCTRMRQRHSAVHTAYTWSGRCPYVRRIMSSWSYMQR